MMAFLSVIASKAVLNDSFWAKCQNNYTRFTRIDPTEYPAPNEQISPTSPGRRSAECFANAMMDPAEEVFA